ncbi:hypothetical protein H6P81_006003 [Aristolochia fimbriata]|uniref:Uncharacterized protein n=1 Tax=Aristolochia fimbriata TaxID=158543 RepID=A0AAV7EXI3_ARIFI|nr:hypothetical protein H6P81_006003 [Aristolochia fimbriata]
MEGLIPLVYRAIVQYRTGGQAALVGSWINDSPSASYMRLPAGDSGRFHQPSEIQFFRPGDYHVYGSASSSSSSSSSSGTTMVINNVGTSSTGSPLRRSTSRRLSAA